MRKRLFCSFLSFRSAVGQGLGNAPACASAAFGVRAHPMFGSHPRLQVINVCDINLQWANQRLQKALGQDVSEVCEYLVNIKEDSELLEFAKGLLGDDGEAFVADLRETRAAAATMKVSVPGNRASDAAPSAAAGAKTQKKGGGGGGQGGYMTGGPDDKRLNKGGSANLRDLSSQRAREADEAVMRLQRNLQAASSAKVGSGSKVDLTSIAPEGMTAYMKADDLDVLGIAGMKKEPKKKGSQGKSMDVLAHVGSGGDSGDENAMPVYQKPKTTRAQRAQMLNVNSDLAFLAPGRHHCNWVGNGSEYKLVGNCLDCGKILCNQEGVGPCLVCGSEHVYLASTNAMLDGTPVDQAIMAKRRRGGGEAGETDEVDVQLLDRDAAEDKSFLRAMDLRDSLLDFEANRAARTTVIDDQSDYFDSSAHWLTDEQKKEAAAKEKEFLDRLNRRRRDVQVSVSIDIAGRRIYGTQDDSPLYPEGAAAAAAVAGVEAAAGGAAGAAGHAGDAAFAAGVGIGGGMDGEGAGIAGRKSRGPTLDLMGPTAERDMNLGARHGVLKEQNIGKAALEGRAHEVYELLMASVLSGDGGGGGGGGKGGGGGGEALAGACNMIPTGLSWSALLMRLTRRAMSSWAVLRVILVVMPRPVRRCRGREEASGDSLMIMVGMAVCACRCISLGRHLLCMASNRLKDAIGQRSTEGDYG